MAYATLKSAIVAASLVASAACTMALPLKSENPQALTAPDGSPLIACFVDKDGDRWGSTQTDDASINDGCPVGTVNINFRGDCNDSTTGYAINPGAAEFCGDGIDNDCDSSTVDNWCSNGGTVHETGLQCADGVDNDADGFVDNRDPDCGVQTTYFRDADGDGFGNAGSSIIRYGVADPGYVVNSTDCNDTLSAINPLAVESCNGIDDNCNVLIDEGNVCNGGGTGACDGTSSDSDCEACFPDADRDGYGTDAVSATYKTTCNTVTESPNNDDCDDSATAIHPGAAEICGDAEDNNCNGQTDEGCSGSGTPDFCEIKVDFDADSSIEGDTSYYLELYAQVFDGSQVVNVDYWPTDTDWNNNSPGNSGFTELLHVTNGATASGTIADVPSSFDYVKLQGGVWQTSSGGGYIRWVYGNYSDFAAGSETAQYRCHTTSSTWGSWTSMSCRNDGYDRSCYR